MKQVWNAMYALKRENARCVDKTSSVYTQANVT